VLNLWTGTVFEEREEKKECIGTVAVRLYDEVVPIAAHNFRERCIGRNGVGYEGSLIKRIIPSFIIQAGFAPVGGGGTGVSGHNLRGGFIGCFIGSVLKAMEDENFARGHDKAGLLSTVDMTKDMEFYIHMGVNEFFNGSNVVFGGWYRFYIVFFFLLVNR
jgi:cyclophilin family peptidyl-prolyl cis-trans isomerase